VILGAGLGTAGIASASSGSPTTSTTVASTSTSTPCPQGAGDPASMTHGPGETLLTGSDLAKATAAAQAAVPGASVVRAETDSSGTYEVHMKKSDGTYVTVKLDSSFVETSIQSGFGPGHRGGGSMGQRGDRPTDAPASPQDPTGAMAR
jgi:hypothetical protein